MSWRAEKVTSQTIAVFFLGACTLVMFLGGGIPFLDRRLPEKQDRDLEEIVIRDDAGQPRIRIGRITLGSKDQAGYGIELFGKMGTSDARLMVLDSGDPVLTMSGVQGTSMMLLARSVLFGTKNGSSRVGLGLSNPPNTLLPVTWQNAPTLRADADWIPSLAMLRAVDESSEASILSISADDDECSVNVLHKAGDAGEGSELSMKLAGDSLRVEMQGRDRRRNSLVVGPDSEVDIVGPGGKGWFETKKD